DAATSRVADGIALDYPALAPVSANQTNLFGCWWRPGCGRLAQNKTANRDVVATRLIGVKHGSARIDFYKLFVRIDSFELRPERRVGRIHLSEPQLKSPRLPCRPVHGQEYVVQSGGFSQPIAVQVHGAGMMLPFLSIEPVAMNQVSIGIER